MYEYTEDMEENIQLIKIFKEVIDYLSPLQTPTEQAIYNYLLRWTYFETGIDTIQVGDRTIAKSIAKSSRSDTKVIGLAANSVGKNIRSLVKKGYIKVIETNRLGKKYKVLLPNEIDACLKTKQERENTGQPLEDYFINSENRKLIFERDKYKCYYCGQSVTKDTATLDHKIPQSKGGSNLKDNLVTCCFECNSIKSGKTLEEVAPLLLERLKNKVNKT